MQTFELEVKQVIQETQEAITIEFAPKEELKYKAGQFLTLKLTIEGQEERRAYSLCTAPEIDEFPAVTVKRVAGGKVSNYLNDNLKAGDKIEVIEPMGFFTTETDAENTRHIVLIGGGSGITPLMSLMQTILKEEPNSIVSLIYANRDEDSIIFKQKIESLVQEYAERLQLIQVLENPPKKWKGFKGLLNPKMFKKILKSLPKTEVASYFMCGPNGMMEQVELAFDKLKLSKNFLIKESFGISPEEAAKEREDLGLKTREVVVKYAGDEFKFKVKPTESILTSAMAHDIDLPFSCQSGMCTACMGKCVSGKMMLDEEDALTPQELEAGYVLTCVGHPLTDDVVIEIE